tara:strand:- start:502 stop:1062 length:561 start_codon:yes stop_codon:yes gene_type:complete
MSKKNKPGSGLTISNKENTTNPFQRFMRYFAPPASESASPYVREGVYTDPFDNPDSTQSKIKSMFTFSSSDDIAEDIKRKLDKKKETETGKVDPSKVPSFEDVMGIGFKDYLGEVAKIGEQAKNKDALRSGISSLAYSPLIGSQAAMDAAANIGQLTGVNMAAIANQGSVMAQNPTKQKIAGKYFR